MNKTHMWIGGILLVIAGFAVGIASSSSESSTAVKAYEMSAEADGVAIWQFPDKRELDPELFGTPSNPLNSDLLPLEARDTNLLRTAYTTIKEPSMFSNNIKETTGSIQISVSDLTAKDGPNSLDEAEVEANFTGPNGEEYKVVLKKLITKGGEHQMFGGVGTDVLMHGSTGVGTPLVAEEFSYITLWGAGDFYKDGELVDEDRIIHIMVSERTRDDEFQIGFGVAQPEELEIHLAMPPRKVTADGPIDSPLKTGVILPNGAEQPFIHTNFYGNVTLDGNQFTK